MFYIIFGTNYKKRELARQKIKSLLNKEKIDFDTLLEVPQITSDNYTLLPSYFSGASLFGEKILIHMSNLLTKEETREYVYKNLKVMSDSANVFLLDEPFALAASFQKVERDLEKLEVKGHAFDASEEKEIKDVEPFYLCELIEKRDKKGAWQEWKKIYEEWGDTEAMAVHGALWWKWKSIWSAFLEGDKRNYFKYRLASKDIKYTKDELENFGKEISFMAMRANNGESNLMRDIEKFILKI